MAKPHSPLLWRRIHRTLSPTPHTLRTSAQTCTALSCHSTPRPFHTTQTRSAKARQTPSLRRAAEHNLPSNFILPHKLPNGLKVDREGFWWGVINEDVNIMVKQFEEAAPAIYQVASQSLMIPPGVNFDTFKTVAEQVIRLAHSVPPTANNIRTISTDVDAVFRMSTILILLPNGPWIVEWMRSACARAKSRRALIEVVNRYIEIPNIDIHRNTEWIALIKDFALIEEWPQAIMLYAKILTWRGETTKAAELLEQKILPFIKPTLRQPHFLEDITSRGKVDSPLRLYGLAIAEKQGIEAVSKVVYRAAMEYSEPIALTELAIAQLEKPDYDAYEEYMAMAATAGYGQACYYLANYYHRISMGEIKSREEREEEKKIARNAELPSLFRPLENLKGWVESVVHRPFGRADYLKLASEWYGLAFATGDTNAGLILALIHRAAGEIEGSRMIFDALPQDRFRNFVPAKALRELNARWDDPTFDPGFPPKLLGLG